ncbi:MAG: hypothetical protein INH43_01300 [Acidobacteriaceae bacterium]|jgi:hypothetical protein|nr:hypothetical protein [Acidobacteriaceae bacterium]
MDERWPASAILLMDGAGYGTLPEQGNRERLTGTVADNSPAREYETVSGLARVLAVKGRFLEEKYGVLYQARLHEAMFFLRLFMQRERIDSPIIAAVVLGVRGDLVLDVGGETVDAGEGTFQFLVQGALSILLIEAATESHSAKGVTVC